MQIRVLSVASELFPLIKTGGLADVTGSLPGALAGHGVHVTSLIPGYPEVMRQVSGATVRHAYADLFGGLASILSVKAESSPELDLLVLDAPHLYDRPGGPYQSPERQDWPDNAVRFAALCWAARDIGTGAVTGLAPPDIVHAHDWQAGLVPAYLHFAGGVKPPTVFTIHNLSFQGQFPASILYDLRLPASAFVPDGLEHYGAIGFLKAGLIYADRLATVSPAYAREIQTPAGGMSLDGVLRRRAARLTGIVNGIDDEAWNPATDPHLAAPFTDGTLDLRRKNKAALRRRFGLADDPSPLFCMVTRLSWQKGVDVVLAALPHLTSLGGQLAVLGDGDPALAASLRDAAQRYPGRVAAVFGYDEALAHLMQGGSDAIVIPSRFEPCGLTQLYGLRYGCIPIVARTGGLEDTVIDANEAALSDGVATGIQFTPVTREALEDALTRAFVLYRTPAVWEAMQRRAMSRDLGWNRRAAAYAGLYRDIAKTAV